MIAVMAKKKTSSESKKPFPSRKNYKGVYIPKTLWEKLNVIAKEQERSLSFMVKKACEEYLKSHAGE